MRGYWIAAAVIGAMLLLGGGGYMTYTHFKQRGIRNNNPGNLRMTGINWKGKVPTAQNTDGSFEQFRDADGIPGHVWGIRAMLMDIRGDIFKDGLDTVRKLITSYAPPSENNTTAYIEAVAASIGKSADAKLLPTDLPALLMAITKHENGVQPYPAEDFHRAQALA